MRSGGLNTMLYCICSVLAVDLLMTAGD